MLSYAASGDCRAPWLSHVWGVRIFPCPFSFPLRHQLLEAYGPGTGEIFFFFFSVPHVRLVARGAGRRRYEKQGAIRFLRIQSYLHAFHFYFYLFFFFGRLIGTHRRKQAKTGERRFPPPANRGIRTSKAISDGWPCIVTSLGRKRYPGFEARTTCCCLIFVHSIGFSCFFAWSSWSALTQDACGTSSEAPAWGTVQVVYTAYSYRSN